jgi:hypothetical protein
MEILSSNLPPSTVLIRLDRLLYNLASKGQASRVLAQAILEEVMDKAKRTIKSSGKVGTLAPGKARSAVKAVSSRRTVKVSRSK